MLNLVLFFGQPLIGQSKLANLQWEIWTGDDDSCPETTTPTHTVTCNHDFYGDQVSCATLHELTGSQFKTQECLLFAEGTAVWDQWMISCPPGPDGSLGFGKLVTNEQGQLRSMKLTCQDDLGAAPKMARSVETKTPYLGVGLGADAPETQPLGASPGPSGKHNNHLAEYIAIPIACAFVLFGICFGIYCFCGRNKKESSSKDVEMEPQQAALNDNAPNDHDDERVHQFIDPKSEPDKDLENPMVVPTPVLAAPAEPVKKQGWLGRKRSLLFGKKKKAPEFGDNVGFQAKSHAIPVENPDEEPKPEEPLTGNLTPELGEELKTAEPAKSTQLTANEPLVATTVADAADSRAGYPVLGSPKGNSLF